VRERELLYDASTAVSYSDPDGIVPTSATLTLKKPDGTTQQSPVVTLPSLSTTVAGGSTATTLILAAVTGILRGDHLAITTAGIKYVVEVATVNGSTKTCTLVTGLPVTPTAGDVVKSLKMSATVTAVGADGIGPNYRLAWVYSDGTSTRQVGEQAAVVRWVWHSPVCAADVREIVAELGGGSRSELWCQDVADCVDNKIRAAIVRTKRRPWLYLSSEVFADVSRSGIRYELAQRGICLGGQVYEAQRELRFAFDDQLSSVITGLAAYDSDSDGTISEAESAPMSFTIQGVR
jgi:hypothetical protein